MNEAENKKEYEMPYLLTPEIAEDKIDSEVDELKKIIAENGGDAIQTDLPEKRPLAYPVKKQTHAYFGIVYFNIDDKEKLDKIKKAVMPNKKILRFLILTHSTSSGLIKPKPNPIIAQPAEPSETPAPIPSFDQKLESILKR